MSPETYEELARPRRLVINDIVLSDSNVADLLSTTHQLCQVFKRRPPLIDDVVEGVGGADRANDDLITPAGKAFVRLIGKHIHRHTERSATIFTYVVVQFRWKVSTQSPVFGDGTYSGQEEGISL